MDVLRTTLGDSPLAMKVLFQGNEEGRVHFDILRNSTVYDGETVTKGDSSLRSLYSEGDQGPAEDEGAGGEDGLDIRFDVTPLGSGRHFMGTDNSTGSGGRTYYPRTEDSAGSRSTREYYHGGQRYQSTQEIATGSGGSGWERFGGLKRSGSGEMPEQGSEDLSDEENRVFLGMQQRQEARDSGDEVDSTSRTVMTPRSVISQRGTVRLPTGSATEHGLSSPRRTKR
jgi:hypothetical protein